MFKDRKLRKMMKEAGLLEEYFTYCGGHHWAVKNIVRDLAHLENKVEELNKRLVEAENAAFYYVFSTSPPYNIHKTPASKIISKILNILRRSLKHVDAQPEHFELEKMPKIKMLRKK